MDRRGVRRSAPRDRLVLRRKSLQRRRHPVTITHLHRGGAMPRCSLLLLVAGAIAGGCARAAPLVAPRLEAVDAIVTPSPSLAASPADPTGGEGAIDDALGRLIPS